MSMLKTQEVEVAKSKKSRKQKKQKAARSRKQKWQKSRKKQQNVVSDNLIQTKTEIRQYPYC